MKVLLDTNVLSELLHGKPHAQATVLAWAESVPLDLMYLSAITVMEQEIGLLRLERRTPPEGAAMRRWWNATRQLFADHILSFSGKDAMLCAPMHVPDKKDYRDSLIAATAIGHGLIVVTRNVADFSNMAGLKLYNPWEYTCANIA